MNAENAEFFKECNQAVVDLCASYDRDDVASSLMLLKEKSKEDLLSILTAAPPIILALADMMAEEGEEIMSLVYEAAEGIKRTYDSQPDS